MMDKQLTTCLPHGNSDDAATGSAVAGRDFKLKFIGKFKLLPLAVPLAVRRRRLGLGLGLGLRVGELVDVVLPVVGRWPQ